MPSVPILQIAAYCGGRPLGQWTLDPTVTPLYAFGRDPRCTVVLPVDLVSRQHGRFVWSGGRWYAEDTGSTQGTYRQGTRMTGAAALEDRDALVLGTGPHAVTLQLRQVRRQTSLQNAQTPTTQKGQPSGNLSSLQLLIFDGPAQVRRVSLDCGADQTLRFGRDPGAEIPLQSPLASRIHGYIRTGNGQCMLANAGSLNGMILNGRFLPGSSQRWMTLSPGDLIRIDSQTTGQQEGQGVLMALSNARGEWKEADLSRTSQITIGRDPSNIVKLPHVGVSRFHAMIQASGSGHYTITDSSTNGTLVNGVAVRGTRQLPQHSVICITTSTLYFCGGKLFYTVPRNGLRIEAVHLTRDVKDSGKTKRILNDVNLTIEPGEFVAIVGGSGCGKSTLLNALTGYDRATSGQVLVGGQSLYPNYDYFKSILGYVPQQDIVYDYLKLRRMLDYTAQLRMPRDTPAQERAKRVDEVLKIVELSEHADSMIKKLSGGQRKRASIAVELLADPGLFYLDEPTSGLDPGTERNLMHTLRNLATEKQKTVIMVTHTTLNLHMCDKIIFMGRGGKLCFCGAPQEALEFFGTDNLVDVYNMLAENTDQWHDKFAARAPADHQNRAVTPVSRVEKPSGLHQLKVLFLRYLNLICNDRGRLLMLLAEPVVLILLLRLCAQEGIYEVYGKTVNMLFTYVCCAIWIGIFNSIQEICKERVILKREYMANLRLGAYVTSKFLAQALLCLVQSVLLMVTFSLAYGLPEEGYFLENPMPEMLLTTYLTVLSSSCMGLIVSAITKNADHAMTASPILLVIQLVFSGILFSMEGALEYITKATISAWAISALGVTANLTYLFEDVQEQNDLIAQVTGKEVPVVKTVEMFERTNENILQCWLIMGAFCLVFCLIAALVLRNVSRDSR